MKKLRRLSEIAAEVRQRNQHLCLSARLLALMLVVVAGFDIISTNAALAAGHLEGNPAVGYFQDQLGTWWSVPKIGIHLLLAMLILWLPSRKMILMARVVVVGYLAIVFNNFYFAGWLV
ncbi:MAG: DUF5658 family protein [Alphaproteobacteria bacterium]